MHATDSTTVSTAGNANPEVFRLMAEAIQSHLTPLMDEGKVREIIGEEIAKVTLPRPIQVCLPDGSKHTISTSAHRQLVELLELVDEGHTNLMMVGPAGSGKTTLAKNLAESLKLDFGFLSLSAGVTETHLIGRTLPDADGAWRFKAGRFVEIYENGGVFLLDEVDAADSNVLVAINAALANGHLVTTDGVIHTRHNLCIIIAAANTWGTGGDCMYVGRNQLDAATLDRFVLTTLYVDYDTDLEGRIAANLPEQDAADLLAWVADLRRNIASKRLRRLASTRLVVNAVKALAKGRGMEKVKGRYFQSWSADERSKVGAY